MWLLELWLLHPILHCLPIFQTHFQIIIIINLFLIHREFNFYFLFSFHQISLSLINLIKPFILFFFQELLGAIKLYHKFILEEETLTLAINHLLNHLEDSISIISCCVWMLNLKIMHYLHFFQIFIHFYQLIKVLLLHILIF